MNLNLDKEFMSLDQAKREIKSPDLKIYDKSDDYPKYFALVFKR